MLMFNKKAVSLIIAYVILITMGLALAGMVYSWLSFYVTPGEEVKCEDGVTIIIRDYSYDSTNNKLNLTLQNKGLFDLDGYFVRASDKDNTSLGVYILDSDGIELKYGQVHNVVYNTNIDEDFNIIRDKLSFVEIQPYVLQNNEKILCGSVAKQILS